MYIGNQSNFRIAFCELNHNYVLCVDRGIPCEGNTQIISYHPENTPEPKYIDLQLKQNEAMYEKLIDSFVGFMQPSCKTFGYDALEPIGLVFLHNLLKHIIDNALKLDYEDKK